MAVTRLQTAFTHHSEPAESFTVTAGGRMHAVHFVQVTGDPKDAEIEFWSIEKLESSPGTMAPSLAAAVALLDDHLIEIPYLHIGENDFIYKFRPEKERNASIYAQDPVSSALYQSQLCVLIKTLARTHERTASEPVALNFGPVSYLVPSHFGFCLGVKNAIERAYETLAANPDRRVFMLSELIHNPYVNEDLLRRGLNYLQTDKGVPFTVTGEPAGPAPTTALLWDTLTPDDIVIIPAFGATDEDKRKLVRKGIAVCQYDATCMLVEKVWKAARAYGRSGHTVIIHGKVEHEETKATFSNTRRYAPAIIVRDLEETQMLGRIIASRDPEVRASFYTTFAGKHTPGFDINRHLERVAVVNQTTLLVNETRSIIAHLRDLYTQIYGPGETERVGGSGRTDTLCYATQVNQDALAKALAEPLDAAFVIGGKNSSNTYQLYRLCEKTLGARAYFIQSEANITSRESVEHFVFPSAREGRPYGKIVNRPLWPTLQGAKRVLVTGGASCPDGIIQQVITRLNSLFPRDQLRDLPAILADLEKTQ
ncbi:MAG: 4-hydroxy-3-methylbut-2-enyl diphosphate reductase [Cephaloticoccus sp.]|nr:4-hydroxy-3-methylbut-2-enyl diphosphate reductase [Cephaloticoccus sp.]MCF7759935.1 4-hydroxy-3-methylbut-2-enyl diphosphate reductase [Cephaloticoccus sp.]